MKEFFDMLNRQMMENYVAVNMDNPVLRTDATPKYQRLVLGQYVYLPKRIVEFLMMALQYATILQACEGSKWNKLVLALLKNISEESGSETNGCPHVEILMQGLKNHGIELVDDAISGTKMFLNDIARPTNRNLEIETIKHHVWRLMGHIYCLECTATPELRIVKHLIEKSLGNEITGDLAMFFDRHIEDFEPGHENDLREALQEVLTERRYRKIFAGSFREAMRLMEDWWSDMDDHAATKCDMPTV